MILICRNGILRLPPMLSPSYGILKTSHRCGFFIGATEYLAFPCCLPRRNGVCPAPLGPHVGPPDSVPQGIISGHPAAQWHLKLVPSAQGCWSTFKASRATVVRAARLKDQRDSLQHWRAVAVARGAAAPLRCLVPANLRASTRPPRVRSS